MEDRGRERSRKEPSAADRADALRLSAYGEPPGLFGAMFYALHVWLQRRRNERRLREAVKERMKAYEATEAAYLELGKRLHARAGEVDLSSVSLFLQKVDHAVLHYEQVARSKRTKQEKALARKRADDALRQLAENALEQELRNADRDGTSLVVVAVRDFEQLDREVRLREVGLDGYDHAAVTRGAILLLLLVTVVAAAGAFAFVDVEALRGSLGAG